MRKIVFLILSVVILSCKKQDPDPTNTNNNNNTTTTSGAQIEVTVKHVYTQSSDSLMPGATILVYSTENDRSNGVNAQYSGTSNSLGEYNLSNLNEGSYYFHISKDTLTPYLDEVNMTENTSKAFVEALLY